MKLKTTRFNEIEIDENAIISVPGGLIGFADQERYVIIEHNPDSPFFWFQSINQPDLAFVIVNPVMFKPDYELDLPQVLLDDMGITNLQDMGIYVIVTIPHGRPKDMTANLMGPLIINTTAKSARQIIVDDEKYPQRYPLMASE